jgi:poly(glycerol-phosphate) alpha-glucosyltransferase
MCHSQKRLTFLTGSISHRAGALFERVRNLAIAVKKENRYLPSVIRLWNSETDRDRSLWGDIKTEALSVRGPSGFGYAPNLARTLELNDPHIIHVHGLWMYPSVAWSTALAS